MVAGYIHIETELSQSPKRPGSPCGDVFLCERAPAGTTMICADGIGSDAMWPADDASGSTDPGTDAWSCGGADSPRGPDGAAANAGGSAAVTAEALPAKRS